MILFDEEEPRRVSEWELDAETARRGTPIQGGERGWGNGRLVLLAFAGLLALLLFGCGSLVTPALRESIHDRLDYAERAVDQSRTELFKLAEISMRNEQRWAEGLPLEHRADTLEGVRKRHAERDRFLAQLDRAEELIRTARTDLEGGR